MPSAIRTSTLSATSVASSSRAPKRGWFASRSTKPNGAVIGAVIINQNAIRGWSGRAANNSATSRTINAPANAPTSAAPIDNLRMRYTKSYANETNDKVKG